MSNYLYYGVPPALGRNSHHITAKSEKLAAVFTSHSDSRGFIQSSEPIDSNRSSPPFCVATPATSDAVPGGPAVSNGLDIYYFEVYLINGRFQDAKSSAAVYLGLATENFQYTSKGSDGASVFLNLATGELLLDQQFQGSMRSDKFVQLQDGDIVGLVRNSEIFAIIMICFTLYCCSCGTDHLNVSVLL